MKHRLGLIPLCITLASCALLTPPQRVNVEQALLNQMPSELPHRETRGATVLVLPPQTTAIYDSRHMAYRSRPDELGYYREREWADTPSRMLQPLLVQALEGTRSFSAVWAAPYTGHSRYALRTEILELTQDFTQSATLVFSLRFQLMDYEGNRIVATKELHLREPMSEKASAAGVVAANEATAEALREMAAFVLDNVQ